MLPEGSPPDFAPRAASRLNTTALLAFLSSILGFVCLWGFGGLLGIILGVVARSEVERAEGREHGRGLANAGVVLGVLNVAFLLIGIAMLATWMATPGAARGPVPTTPPPPLVMPGPPNAPSPTPERDAAGPAGQATRERDQRVTKVGSITLVDPGGAAGRLPVLLQAEQATALAEKQKLVVWLVAAECSPCNGVAAALPDGKLQKALSGVRLLRLDVHEFAPELARLGVPAEHIPGFALLGPDLRVLDYVNGGEWDADIPRNIAPVLGAFVRGTYTKRRHQFRATLRGDEQAL